MNAFTFGCCPCVIWSAQSGIHCTIPHVTISATEEKQIASSVFFHRPLLKISRTGFDGLFFTASFHASDSGTKYVITSVSSAGAAPTSITHRHDSRVIAKFIPITAITAYPRFAAAPINPAISGRFLAGQHSITSATPSDHSPPIPSAAMNRNAARCHGTCAKYPSPVNAE